MNDMPKMFEKLARSKGLKIDVTMSAKSNHTFKMHCNRPELFETIRSKKWDYVVIQGFSRELSYEPAYMDTATVPYFKTILDSVYTNKACTNVLLYMTWGYKEGSQMRPETDTYLKMSQKIEEGYTYLSNMFNLPIVPVGNVWKAVREKDPTVNLYRDDNQHPTPYGSYLISCAFYTSIFKSSPEGAIYTADLLQDKVLTIQQTAYEYVDSHLDLYKLKMNTLEIKSETINKRSYYVHCKSNYTTADSLIWTFSDGKTSNLPSVTHKFKHHGTHTVNLKVYDKCGLREVTRNVVYKAPVKPKRNKKHKPRRGSETIDKKI